MDIKNTRHVHQQPQSIGSNSPEFEFWMLRNPSYPNPNLTSADQLFLNGVLLPLHHRTTKLEPELKPKPEPNSKRWKHMFKKTDKTPTNKKDKKKPLVGASAITPELNINIWPFSRSRSAGNNTARPGLTPARKVSSAPCSRSNSAGESKSRKWPSSPGQAGVHLGRTSPVWHVRGPKGLENCVKKVPMCVGYRQSLSCTSSGSVDGPGGCSRVRKSRGAARTSGHNHFDIRSLFSKKVY